MWRSGASPWATIPIPGSTWCRARIASRPLGSELFSPADQRRMSTIVTSMLPTSRISSRPSLRLALSWTWKRSSQGFAHT